jgi:hypothetical protein
MCAAEIAAEKEEKARIQQETAIRNIINCSLGFIS